jgi:hypothetical protein
MDKQLINYKCNRSRNEQIGNYYSPYISFSQKTKSYLDKYFIEPRIGLFLKKYKIQGGQLNNSVLLSDIFFAEIDLGSSGTSNYFYDEVLGNLLRDPKTGKLAHTVMYSITFSQTMAPSVCPETGIRYGCIKLYTTPVFYYIYFDLTDVVNFLEKIPGGFYPNLTAQGSGDYTKERQELLKDITLDDILEEAARREAK